MDSSFYLASLAGKRNYHKKNEHVICLEAVTPNKNRGRGWDCLSKMAGYPRAIAANCHCSKLAVRVGKFSVNAALLLRCGHSMDVPGRAGIQARYFDQNCKSNNR